MARFEDDTVNISAAVVQSSPSAIIAADLDGKIIGWNPAAERLLGFSAAEALGADILSIMPDSERAEAARMIACARRGEVVANQQVTRLRRDGSLMIGNLTVAPITNSGDEVHGTVGIMHDVTAQKAMEELLRRNRRLAAVGTLAAGIAHEINNPVGGILMAAQYASAALEREDARAVVEKALADIETDAKRCSAIVRDLLGLTRGQFSERADCDLCEVVEAAIDLARRVHSGNAVEVQFARPTEALSARIDRSAIEQALVNVISNAMQAGSSRVRVEARQDTSKRLRITVVDDGTGIAEDLRDHLFEPFFTTKRGQGGTGLGLSVAHAIVTDHGGSLDVTSSPPSGTTVTLELPGKVRETG